MRIFPKNESTVPYAATEYSLVCQIDVNTMYVDTEVEAVVVWMDSGGQLVTNTRITASDTETQPEGGYESTLTFSPLSLTDSREFICRAIIVPDTTSLFVTASNPEMDAYTINITGTSCKTHLSIAVIVDLNLNFPTLSLSAPPEADVVLSVVGSGVAGEALQIQCISEFIQSLFKPPTVVILNALGVEVDSQQTDVVIDSLVNVTALLDPLLTSDSGVYTCLSSYDFPEAGLVDTMLYSARRNITVTVASKNCQALP